MGTGLVVALAALAGLGLVGAIVATRVRRRPVDAIVAGRRASQQLGRAAERRRKRTLSTDGTLDQINPYVYGSGGGPGAGC